MFTATMGYELFKILKDYNFKLLDIKMLRQTMLLIKVYLMVK